jgi:transcriptional regulator with XRE-family HTH domain
MRSEIEHSLPRQVFAARVREARERRGWTQQQLADRLAEIGYTDETGTRLLARSTLAKIEDGRGDGSGPRSNASLEDVLALAAALDCSPMHLLVPRDADESVQVARHLVAPAPILGEWIAGIATNSEPLRISVGAVEKNGRDVEAFLAQMPRWYAEAALARMGLSPDQVEDTLHMLDTGEIPWLSGDPRLSSKDEGGKADAG